MAETSSPSTVARRSETAAAQFALEASRLSASGRYRDAIELQSKAVKLFRQLLNDLGDRVASDAGSEAARLLADHHGQLGGIYRRADLLNQAKKHYAEGADIEREWNLDVTYNRTNHLVVSVLLQPDRVPELAPEISSVAETIGRQVLRDRRNEWWAWADLALLNLLSGRPADALWAYHRFTGTGPRRRDYESALSVLLDVKVALAGVRWERSAALVEHVSAAIAYLRGRRDELASQNARKLFTPAVWIRCLEQDSGDSVQELRRAFSRILGRNRVYLDIVSDSTAAQSNSMWVDSIAHIRAVVVVAGTSAQQSQTDVIASEAGEYEIPVHTLIWDRALASPGTALDQVFRVMDLKDRMHAMDAANAAQWIVDSEPQLLLPTVLQARPVLKTTVHDLIRRSNLSDKRRLPPPSVLLRPEYGVIPFRKRDEELRILDRWLRDTPVVSLMLIAAPGGSGKTRIAQELVEHARAEAWTAGFLAENADLREIRRHRTRLLLVVDYAEARTDQISELLTARQPDSEALRVLLLARSPGLWLQRLREHPQSRVRSAASAVSTLSLPEWIGDDEYVRARGVFSNWLGVREPSGGKVSGDREGLHTPLDIHTTALATVLEAVDDTSIESTPLRQALNHERRYWARTLVEHDLGGRLDAVDQVVAVATLCGSPFAPSIRLLSKLPALINDNDDHLNNWRAWLSAIYPSPAGFVGLQPDLLGEELIAEVVEAAPGLLGIVAPVFEEQQFARAFAVFSRAAGRRPAFAGAMSDLISANPIRAISIAMTVTTRAETPIPPILEALIGTTVEGQFHSEPDPLRKSEDVNALLASFSVVRTRAALRSAKEIGDAESVAHLVHQLARKLGAAGQFSTALEHAQDASVRLRGLAAQDDNLRSDHATSLVTLAKASSRVGREREAMRAVTEAIKLASSSGSEVESAALLVRGDLFCRRRDARQALRDLRKAVTLRRSVADDGAEAKDRLASALEQYGSAQLRFGRAKDAIPNLVEAAEVLRQLDSTEPSWFRSDLVRVLTLVSQAQADNDLQAALQTIESAVTLGRLLLHRYGARHAEPLLTALQHASILQERAGNKVAVAEMRAGISLVTRRLGDERPDIAALIRLDFLRTLVTDSQTSSTSGTLGELERLVETLHSLVEAGRPDLADAYSESVELLKQLHERYRLRKDI